ncbi:nucleotidyltransferase family protein [Dermabacter sp. p3-SID358]|uniref:nucleotidyltransferase family protein n=1 Tax=Dermabacter sp. p3-SID358 TaxID=2916114 RepID=UPI0021A56B63|nr:nucleotidyltransferase family protein [Dermabacter sp. p3-SID358]MCT1867238.1 nucleotidyltransferase family protein [Dermabacter sp. p3-SID358]
MINTAVILARGLGTRMRAEGETASLSAEQAAAASLGYKALMPIGEHRLIDYSLSSLADVGITRAIIVVAPEHEAFREHARTRAPKRMRIDFAVQQEALGTANALASAEKAVGEEPFLMLNGDNLYPHEALEAMTRVTGNAIAGFERMSLVENSNIPAERIAAFALIRHSERHLTGMIEKPSEAERAKYGENAPVSMNLFAFEKAVFEACRAIVPSARGEYEIVDAVLALADVQVVPVSGGVLDLSRRDDIADVERRLAHVSVRL